MKKIPIRQLGAAHQQRQLDYLVFKDGARYSLKAIYTPSPFEQHCKLPEQLGCLLTDEGYIQTGPGHQTSIQGVYAVGDNASRMRTVANAVAMGNAAGISLSKKMIVEQF